MTNVPMDMEAFEKTATGDCGFSTNTRNLNFVTNTVASERWR